MKRKKPTKVPEVLPIEAFESRRRVGVTYVRVGNVFVPRERMKRVPMDPRFHWTWKGSEGDEITIDCNWETESKLPFGPVGIPADIDDAFNDNGIRMFEQWKGLYDLIRRGGDENEVEATVGLVKNLAINSVEIGFYLALLRYADDLKNAPEAAAILEGLKKGRKKGTETTKRKAEPRKMAVRRRFRALRKSGFNKGDAREEIQQEYRSKGEEISVRQIERYTEGLS